ncbi:MAG: UDP-N-acetylglucosamine 2-epimerase (non-hydrolyzing) [Actinomycetales bacterium]|nr:MAG: UDP-N-acetylglucosamine 2-epimerase (non-hydrolyzing) [Actinomycetales bacterium]
MPVVHLEAGLRSGNIKSPFPEEANRKIISQIAALHLTPTAGSKQNLLVENHPEKDIVITGNTVIDALLQAVSYKTDIVSDVRLAAAVADQKPLILVTTHRRESWQNMSGVGKALRRLAQKYPQFSIVLPAHRNPIVRNAILPQLEGLENTIATEPLPYNEFTQVMKAAHIVLTDSGGVQEEAPALGKPVLVMRENTERPEAVTAGTVRLIGTDEDRIVDEVSTLIDDQKAYDLMANAVNPYGDGKAAQRSVAAIAELLGVGTRLPDFSS